MAVITAAIDPITRIEGHLKMEVDIDTVDGVQQVVDARAIGTLFRGFEKFLEGRDPRELIYDYLIEGEGKNFIFAPFANYAAYNLDCCSEMMQSPHTLIGLGDGGAHVGLISDGSYPTYLLQHWGRDRKQGRLDLSWLVKRHTHDNAKAVGLGDRGLGRGVGGVPGLARDEQLVLVQVDNQILLTHAGHIHQDMEPVLQLHDVGRGPKAREFAFDLFSGFLAHIQPP